KAGLKVSGVLRYDQRPDGSVIEPGVTENDRLIELAWGGVANVVVAETLFHLAEQGFWPEAEDRVRQMIEAILHFADGGFQVQDGPCRGAWWNGYIVEQRRFASRYGRAHVETPNQGFVNYFLYRLWSLGATRDPDLPRRIEHNCTRFLQSIERPEGGVEYARYTDGRTGQSRFYEDYTRGYACGTAMTALSWLCAWRLTGIPDYRQQAKRLFDFLVDETARNEWRFLEYDTTGADTAAPAWVLIALCEAIQDLDCPAYRQAADRTFDLLWILRYHVQPDMERYKAKEAVWGGRMLIKGGMVHGSTPGSRQGSHAAHIRYDFPLAFEQYWRLTGRSKAYAAMIGYLNFQTWHQFTRTDLPIGTGTTTEQCSLVWDYVQDTAQIKHSNPLVMLALTPWLQCLGTNAEITLAQRPDANSLCLDLHSLGEAPTWLEWDRPARIYDEGELIGPGPATRFVLPPRQRRRLKAIVACSDSSP
ncbi:MAG TPA: hypothetical protein DCX07_14020, partial [Phycisphaerales bacterium]|nr:hypothetical protein [Phycisphaerales bacterium]